MTGLRGTLVACMLIALLVVGLLFGTTISVAQASSKVPVEQPEPIYEEGIALLSGESWKLYQGYEVHIEGVDFLGENVWVEITLKNSVIFSGVASKGDIIDVYRLKNGISVKIIGSNSSIFPEDLFSTSMGVNENNTSKTLVMSIKIYEIYTGGVNDMVLMRLTQYEDSALPMSSPPEEQGVPSNNSEIKSFKSHPSEQSRYPVGVSTALVIVLSAVLMTLVLIYMMRKGK